VKENDKGIKILVLENNAADAKTIRVFLLGKNLKYEFSVVANEANYLKALNEFCPDIILSDHPLAKVTFIDVLTTVRCRHISWRKKAEGRSNYIKSLEKMLFKISHELRGPIANLLGLINVSRYSDNSPEELRHIMSCIYPTVNARCIF
jgi:CheY-like chemotaxis protein